MDYSLPGSSVHGILQARILEWVAIPLSRGSSWPRDQTLPPALQAGSLPSLQGRLKAPLAHRGPSCPSLEGVLRMFTPSHPQGFISSLFSYFKWFPQYLWCLILSWAATRGRKKACVPSNAGDYFTRFLITHILCFKKILTEYYKIFGNSWEKPGA